MDNKNMVSELYKIYKESIHHYIKVTTGSALISLLFLLVATQIDLRSGGTNSLTEDVLDIVSPKPLAFLIGIYFSALGVLAFLGQRLHAAEKRKGFIYTAITSFEKIASFARETNLFFFGFLIACGIFLMFRGTFIVLISSLAVTSVIFFLFGIIDFIYQKFNMINNKRANPAMVYLQEILLGLILIGLSLPIFRIAYAGVL